MACCNPETLCRIFGDFHRQHRRTVLHRIIASTRHEGSLRQIFQLFKAVFQKQRFYVCRRMECRRALLDKLKHCFGYALFFHHVPLLISYF